MVERNIWGESVRKRKPISKATKDLVKKAQGYRCYKCRKKFSPSVLAVHHRTGNRTNNSPKFLVALCHNCHSQAHKYVTRTERDFLGVTKRRVLVAKSLRKGRPKKRVKRRKKRVQRDIFGNKISGNLFSGYKIT